MKIGVISWCVSEKAKGLLKKIRVFEYDEFVSAELPFSLEEVEVMRKSKLQKWLNKAEKALKEKNTDKIILVNELRNEPFDESEVFYRFAPKIVRNVAEYFEISFPLKLYIKQRCPDEKMLSLAKALIYETKGIGMLAEDESYGKRISDEILYEFGEYVENVSYEFAVQDGICVDLDESSVLVFGKWKLEKFSLKEEIHGYSLNSTELHWLKYGNFDKFTVKECQCGKNKLTLTRK